MNCSKCGSDKIMTNVKIVDHGYMDSKHDLSIEFHKNPNAWVVKGTQKGTLFANVCGQCGYVELSVGNPEELWDLYKKNRNA
jgi:uncharacterized OB-fold protein